MLTLLPPPVAIFPAVDKLCLRTNMPVVFNYSNKAFFYICPNGNHHLV